LLTVTPDNRQYPDLISGYNQRWAASPESVILVETTAQVVQAVQQAARDGKRITINSAGHCLADFVYNDETQVIIDMRAMKDVYFDPEYSAVAVESGATLLDVYRKLYEFWGITIPAGICYSVGAGGHVSGGGFGVLCRQHGLVVDHLYAV
jgi:FAD/FMN-containing dehydrogenase